MGLVSRGANEADKRGLLLALTEEGRKRVGQIQEIKEEMALNFFGQLTEADARTILDLLAKGQS
jgi:DNA-binding MarR family transcriptional regulator